MVRNSTRKVSACMHYTHCMELMIHGRPSKTSRAHDGAVIARNRGTTQIRTETEDLGPQSGLSQRIKSRSFLLCSYGGFPSSVHGDYFPSHCSLRAGPAMACSHPPESLPPIRQRCARRESSRKNRDHHRRLIQPR